MKTSWRLVTLLTYHLMNLRGYVRDTLAFAFLPTGYLEENVPKAVDIQVKHTADSLENQLLDKTRQSTNSECRNALVLIWIFFRSCTMMYVIMSMHYCGNDVG